MARKHGVPMYGTKETLEEIGEMKSLGDYSKDLFCPVCPDVGFTIGDMEIKPFSIDHDAANPVAYRIQSGKSPWQWPRTWGIMMRISSIISRVLTRFFWNPTTM